MNCPVYKAAILGNGTSWKTFEARVVCDIAECAWWNLETKQCGILGSKENISTLLYKKENQDL
jgi:hypothetical protein